MVPHPQLQRQATETQLRSPPLLQVHPCARCPGRPPPPPRRRLLPHQARRGSRALPGRACQGGPLPHQARRGSRALPGRACQRGGAARDRARQGEGVRACYVLGGHMPRHPRGAPSDLHCRVVRLP
ncbi:phospholipase D delta-like [Iris pallida]|uniref:Phospholipase D delta-like n=1 Tax=Iris pallida TaxID=29817 RepID=A0AAX6HCA5_IRIPA|nr:phospholipase D delta-like [Iris pallida]